MADTTLRSSCNDPCCCDDSCCERGKRGKRGKTGPTGPTGPTGASGRDGATGPTGPASQDEECCNRVVLRPGVPSNPPYLVFDNWNDAYAALLTLAPGGEHYLEFDDRFGAIVVPVGSWDMTNVVWTNTRETSVANPVTLVTLADGASITSLTGSMRWEGYGLLVRSNRTGSVAPFVNVNLMFDGSFCRLDNNDPNALPAFECGGNNTINVLGSCNGVVSGRAPVIDLKSDGIGADQFAFRGANGALANNMITDTGVGVGVVVVIAVDDAFGGQNVSPDLVGPSFDFPLFIANNGLLILQDTSRDRHLVKDDEDTGLVLTVTATLYPNGYHATYNELVRVDTTDGRVIIIAPPARAKGERLTVKDFAGNAAVAAIVIDPDPSTTDVVESGLINTAFGSKTWVSDGDVPTAHWILVAQV